ncbi:MAG: MFS transporter [Myxococcota bacterium]
MESRARDPFRSVPAQRSQDRARLTGAFAAFSIAEGAIWIALLVYAYERGGVAEASALAILLLAPSAVLAPAFGALASRSGPVLRRALGLQAGLAAGVGAVLAGFGDGLWPYAGAALLCASLSATRPIVSTLLPVVSGPAPQLSRANAMIVLFEGVGDLAGPLLAALVLGAAGPAAVLYVASVLLAVAAWTTRAAHVPDHSDAGITPAPSPLALTPDRWLLVTCLALPTLLFGAVELLAPAIGAEMLGVTGQVAGYLVAMLGCGGVAGALLARTVGTRSDLVRRHGVATLVSAAAFFGIGASYDVWTTLFLLFLCGVANGYAWVVGMSLVQRVATNAERGFLFGMLESGEAIGLALVTLGIAAVTVGLGVRGTFAIFGMCIACIVLVSQLRLRGIGKLATLPSWAAR